MSLSISLGILLFMMMFEKGTKSEYTESYLHFIVQKVRLAIQNFLIMQFYNSYGDIVLFSVLDISTVDFSTTPASLSFNMAVLFTVAGFVAIVLNALLLIRYQRVKRQESAVSAVRDEQQEDVQQFVKRHEGVQVLFFSFKDASIVTQGFFLFLGIRNACYSLLLTLLYKYPLVQLTLMLALSVLMVAYLLFARPFKQYVNLFQQLFGELVLLVVNSSLLGMYILTTRSSDPRPDIQANLNETVIMSNMMVGFISPVFLFIKLVVIGVNLIKTRREWTRQQGRVADILEEQIKKALEQQKQRKQPKDQGQGVKEPKYKQTSLVSIDSKAADNIVPMRKMAHDLLKAVSQLNVKQPKEDDIDDSRAIDLSQTRKILFSQRKAVYIPKHLMVETSLNQLDKSDTVNQQPGKEQSIFDAESMVYERQHDYDASATNFKLDISDLDVPNKSVELRKSRWLNQKKRADKLKLDE